MKEKEPLQSRPKSPLRDAELHAQSQPKSPPRDVEPRPRTPHRDADHAHHHARDPKTPRHFHLAHDSIRFCI